MERKTQRIIAVVVVAIIGVGAIAGIAIFLLLPPANPYTYPGLGDEQKPLENTIKVGILDDMSWSGEGCWQGAWIAAERINTAGGIEINGIKYWVGMVAEDTKEGQTSATVTDANNAAYRMVGHAPNVILGGFRTERLSSYQDIIMEAKIPFIITGSASEKFCKERISAEPDFYKYTFRCMPTNNKIQGEVLGKYLATRLIENISTHIDFPVTNITIVTEELDWTELVADYVATEILKVFPSMYFFNVTVPQGSTSENYQTGFATIMLTANATKCPLIVQVVSDTNIGGAMGGFYGTFKPRALLCGVNILAQFGSYLTYTSYGADKGPYGISTGGLYEITSHAYAELNITSLTLDFLSEYRTKWSVSPIYTSIGGFNGLRIAVDAMNKSGSFNADTLVTTLEGYDIADPFQGVTSKLAFDQYHDYVGLNGSLSMQGFAETLWRQWQPLNTTLPGGPLDGNCSNPLIPGWFYGDEAFGPIMADWYPSASDLAVLPIQAYKNEVMFPHWWPAA